MPDGACGTTGRYLLSRWRGGFEGFFYGERASVGPVTYLGSTDHYRFAVVSRRRQSARRLKRILYILKEYNEW